MSGTLRAMYGTSERLLRLLSLLQARRDWPGADLAARLEVDVRTIRRDVERLRSLGYPVHATPGVAGGYRLGAGAALPPLLLDDDEAVAVAVGLRTAASGTVSGIEETWCGRWRSWSRCCRPGCGREWARCRRRRCPCPEPGRRWTPRC
ncbi:HTH type 11 transcriptional regulator [Amycolatopsis mediterranei U32]|uniref:HTH type 11 transcriptional regulator n=1 Tax=Amycolatopsis mediterranei (strain U-32) TaxID=749927 RepID=A0A0H3D187_AMYMU|nr:HTH type 11 transcriptional regulator [Amycolatopsis mediterranei U32]